MNLLRYIFYSLFLVAAFSCAKQTAPTGGPKDTIPPVLIKSYPPKQQTHFQGNKIELYFNEPVTLANPKEQIMTIPDIGKEYDVIVSKRKVVLELKTKLNDSTTYAINFRDAIQDITEKNPAINLKIAFSTGSYIDSLSIKGTVTDLIKNTKLKEATVALYQSDTFNIFKHKPIYVTKTNPEGKFIIENLKPGNYFIYAIDDKSRNLIVDSKNEAYGFLTDTIKLNQNVSDVYITTSKLDTRALKLTSARPYNTYFNIKTSKNLASYKITSFDKEPIYSGLGEDNANIRIYNTISTDSIAIRLLAKDSTSNQIDTTLYVKFSTRQTKPEPFGVTKDKFRVVATSAKLSGKIKFNKPIGAITYDSIYYKIDSITTINFSKEHFTFDSTSNTLTIENNFDKSLLPKAEDKTKPNPQPPTQGKKPAPQKTPPFQFYLGKGSFISIENDSSSQTMEILRPLAIEDLGTITVEAKTEEANIVVQLLDKSFKVLQSITNTKKVTFHDLNPGDYLIRLIIDKDKNGEWTPSNFFIRRESEPIIYYTNEKGNSSINLKANWDRADLLITY